MGISGIPDFWLWLQILTVRKSGIPDSESLDKHCPFSFKSVFSFPNAMTSGSFLPTFLITTLFLESSFHSILFKRICKKGLDIWYSPFSLTFNVVLFKESQLFISTKISQIPINLIGQKFQSATLNLVFSWSSTLDF